MSVEALGLTVAVPGFGVQPGHVACGTKHKVQTMINSEKSGNKAIEAVQRVAVHGTASERSELYSLNLILWYHRSV